VIIKEKELIKYRSEWSREGRKIEERKCEVIEKYV
jgi:hypothetical protein